MSYLLCDKDFNELSDQSQIIELPVLIKLDKPDDYSKYALNMFTKVNDEIYRSNIFFVNKICTIFKGAITEAIIEDITKMKNDSNMFYEYADVMTFYKKDTVRTDTAAIKAAMGKQYKELYEIIEKENAKLKEKMPDCFHDKKIAPHTSLTQDGVSSVHISKSDLSQCGVGHSKYLDAYATCLFYTPNVTDEDKTITIKAPYLKSEDEEKYNKLQRARQEIVESVFGQAGLNEEELKKKLEEEIPPIENKAGDFKCLSGAAIKKNHKPSEVLLYEMSKLGLDMIFNK